MSKLAQWKDLRSHVVVEDEIDWSQNHTIVFVLFTFAHTIIAPVR